VFKKLSDKLRSLTKVQAAQLLLAVVLLVIVAANVTPAAQTVFNTYAQSGAAKKKLPIYSVDTPDKKIAVTFDAAWGADDTDDLIRILAENNVRATFFLCGTWVDKYPDEVKRLFDAGHDIGNHGNTHAHGNNLSLEQNKNEILRNHEKIKAIIGEDINLFRPPFGEYNDTVVTAIEEVNYYGIQWDVDSHDWMNKGVDYEINRVLNNKNLQNGSILLFHNDAHDTPKCLDTILKGLREKGYEFVPVSELIMKENYYLDYTGRQRVKQG
jgi:polysaccharide deacetylase family sporulation protein PdaB